MSVANLVALAPLFRYPDEDFGMRLHDALRVVPSLEPFAHLAETTSRDSLQAIYSSTFDLAPSCSPYLGSHVFGDESPARARFMAGLRAKGIGSAELPDHVAELLEHANAFDADEWRDMRDLVLLPALAKMNALLPPSNPYRHLVAAALTEGGAS